MPDFANTEFTIARDGGAFIFSIFSDDGTNRLTQSFVASLAEEIEHFGKSFDTADYPPQTLILAGNEKLFSVGADLNEISRLSGASAYDFALAGQRLMDAVDKYPAPVIAAIDGYCMGGGLDLALACDFRICSPKSVFGHRGAALGIMTGWGGTQRLPRLIGKARAMQMFLLAEKLPAKEALRVGLVDEIAPDPARAALKWTHGKLLASSLDSHP